MIILRKLKFRNYFEIDFTNPTSVIYWTNNLNISKLIDVVKDISSYFERIVSIGNLDEIDGEVEYELNPQYFKIDSEDLIVIHDEEIYVHVDSTTINYNDIKRKLQYFTVYELDRRVLLGSPISPYYNDKELKLKEIKLDYMEESSIRINDGIIFVEDIRRFLSERDQKRFNIILEKLSENNQVILTTNDPNLKSSTHITKISLPDNFFSHYFEEISSKICFFFEVEENENVAYIEFLKNIETVESLLKNVQVSDVSLQERLYGMLFVNVITSMEAYLSETFIETVLNKKHLMARLLRNSVLFNQKKFRIGSVYDWILNVEGNVKKRLSTVSFHNLERVEEDLYRNILNVRFPEDLADIKEAVEIRHFIVHKNGITPKNKKIIITPSHILDLISKIKQFISQVDKQIIEMRNTVEE